MNEFFYGTLPEDTQDFTQVLRGVKRSLGDVARGVSYYPYDLLGSGVDIANMALTPLGLGSERPVLGSDYLRNIAQSLGFAQPSTGSGAETAARFGAAFINPAAGARAVGQIPQAITRGANVSADKLVQMITQNPRATAMGVIDETSMPFMQAMAPKPPGLMEPAKSDIGFYSQLEAATIPLQNKGTGDQYLAQIQKSAGVKPEEIQWTGLDEFLKGKKSVTKTEIQDYLNANRVDVREVRLGDYSKYGLEDMWEAASNRTKFSQYTLPGGENYREILLTLPSGPRQTKFEVFDPSTQRAVPFETREEAVAFANQDPTRSSVVAEVDVSKPEYRSSHFDQPNILAHMRVNDRVVDGKKTLFIEEIQSDWHQAGRKKGYADTQKPFEVFSTDDYVAVAKFATEQEAKDYAAQLGTKFKYDKTYGVPDAPFKTSWHELTLKRAIQEASEKGYDQIAFTTGKTQAERYDLSKQVDSVTWIPKGDGTYDFEVLKDDATIMSKRDADASWLEDNVGKELAQKIVNDQHTDILEGSGRRFIEGNDLSVGGEGMKGFYDQILPKSLEKLGKKFDAKVGKTEMDGVEVWQMDITPKMRESVTTKGQPLFAVPAAGLLGAGMYQDEQMY
jgi:hypothetical protein